MPLLSKVIKAMYDTLLGVCISGVKKREDKNREKGEIRRKKRDDKKVEKNIKLRGKSAKKQFGNIYPWIRYPKSGVGSAPLRCYEFRTGVPYIENDFINISALTPEHVERPILSFFISLSFHG